MKLYWIHSMIFNSVQPFQFDKVHKNKYLMNKFKVIVNL